MHIPNLSNQLKQTKQKISENQKNKENRKVLWWKALIYFVSFQTFLQKNLKNQKVIVIALSKKTNSQNLLFFKIKGFCNV